jgi:hypothetical protein
MWTPLRGLPSLACVSASLCTHRQRSFPAYRSQWLVATRYATYTVSAANISPSRHAHPPLVSLCLLPNVTLLVSHSYKHLFCNWSAALLAIAATSAAAALRLLRIACMLHRSMPGWVLHLPPSVFGQGCALAVAAASGFARLIPSPPPL